MTAPANVPSRREALAKARQSRRPSRLGTPAGAAPGPDHERDRSAGFVALLREAWARAERITHLHDAVDTVLTLAGAVPADVSLRGLPTPAAGAVEALWAASWRGAHRCRPHPADEIMADRITADRIPAFLGEFGLGTDGRLRITTPSEPPLDRASLVGDPRQVPWSAAAVARYELILARARQRSARAVLNCRRWLDLEGEAGRSALLDRLREAALHTAPFVLYQEDHTYTNFRERNTMVGKTLWPGHPDCVFTTLQRMPLPLWSDHDLQMVVCLTVLVRSGSPGRIEEANGTQLTLDNVAYLLERIRLTYNGVAAGPPLAPAADNAVETLYNLAGRLAERRVRVAGQAQLYREIHGALLYKVERVAQVREPGVQERDHAMAERLAERLPVSGSSLARLTDSLADAPGWLARPHGEFGTGLESLVFETVRAATDVFRADFAMSRGMRDLGALIAALRTEDWGRIARWELPDYFCCVLPAPGTERHFPGGAEQVADMAWAISSRMQYNSWHFVPGNLPAPATQARRDWFIPPTMPDVAHFSDQHHHGHVSAKVRFTIRSPQSVEILGMPFKGFIDLRLLRCAGEPFEQADLLAAHRASRFVARATTVAADLAAAGTPVRVTAFDSRWHWTSVMEAVAAARVGGSVR